MAKKPTINAGHQIHQLGVRSSWPLTYVQQLHRNCTKPTCEWWSPAGRCSQSGQFKRSPNSDFDKMRQNATKFDIFQHFSTFLDFLMRRSRCWGRTYWRHHQRLYWWWWRCRPRILMLLELLFQSVFLHLCCNGPISEVDADPTTRPHTDRSLLDNVCHSKFCTYHNNNNICFRKVMKYKTLESMTRNCSLLHTQILFLDHSSCALDA